MVAAELWAPGGSHSDGPRFVGSTPVVMVPSPSAHCLLPVVRAVLWFAPGAPGNAGRVDGPELGLQVSFPCEGLLLTPVSAETPVVFQVSA